MVEPIVVGWLDPSRFGCPSLESLPLGYCQYRRALIMGPVLADEEHLSSLAGPMRSLDRGLGLLKIFTDDYSKYKYLHFADR